MFSKYVFICCREIRLLTLKNQNIIKKSINRTTLRSRNPDDEADQRSWDTCGMPP